MVTAPDPLDVDADRPAVAWVTSLPHGWTTSRERLVLLLLALDTYDRTPPFRCRPSRDQLAAWSGELGGRISETITSLERPSGTRPALLLVGRNRGRGGNVYELITSQEWSGTADDSLTENGPAQRTVSGRESSGTADGYESSGTADHSGQNRPINRPENRPAQRTTPFPTPTSTPPPAYVTGDARAAAEAVDIDTVRRAVRSRADVDLDRDDAAEVASRLRAGWSAGDLVTALTKSLNGVASRHGVIRSRLKRLGPPPATGRPPWCGDCDERTRLLELDDGRATRCHRCHPAASSTRTTA